MLLRFVALADFFKTGLDIFRAHLQHGSQYLFGHGSAAVIGATDPEIVESRFPVRLRRFALREGTGGDGRYRGGDGLVRTFEALAPLTVSILSDRRRVAPFGLAGGEPGATGCNRIAGKDVPGRKMSSTSW